MHKNPHNTPNSHVNFKIGNHDVNSVRVDLDERSYDILISHNWMTELGRCIRDVSTATEVMVFTSPRIGDLHFSSVRHALQSAGINRIIRHDIPDGEINKNQTEYLRCLSALIDSFPDAGVVPLVINLGGGVVGDIGGFAAGTFRRGVPYIQVPTTLLAYVDCGVGGKLGINHGHVKNIVGIFWQPKLVFTDLGLIKSLSDREFRSGLAEVIKYGIVCDSNLLHYLEENLDLILARNMDALRHVVLESCRIKAQIVKADEKDDRDVRIVLNYGHTIGHALEMAANLQMTHGEAISIGMVAEAKLALALGMCSNELYLRIVKLFERAGLPTRSIGYDVHIDQIMDRMQHDKKFIGGKNRFALPTQPGHWKAQEGISGSLIKKVLSEYVAA